MCVCERESARAPTPLRRTESISQLTSLSLSLPPSLSLCTFLCISLFLISPFSLDAIIWTRTISPNTKPVIDKGDRSSNVLLNTTGPIAWSICPHCSPHRQGCIRSIPKTMNSGGLVAYGTELQQIVCLLSYRKMQGVPDWISASKLMERFSAALCRFCPTFSRRIYLCIIRLKVQWPSWDFDREKLKKKL